MVVLESCRPQHGDLGSQLSWLLGVSTSRSDSGWGSTCDSTWSHRVLEYVTRHRPTIIGFFTTVCLWVYGWVRLGWQLASDLQSHTKKPPNHSTMHNIKSHHNHHHSHLTILILPVANCCTYSTRKLPKWWARVSDSRKGWGWWVVFLFQREWW